jgi:SlyX protein
MTDTDKRIAALEERIAHQDHIIEDLSDMSVKQWKEISELSDKLGYLKSKLEELEDGGGESPGKEPPPPHY